MRTPMIVFLFGLILPLADGWLAARPAPSADDLASLRRAIEILRQKDAEKQRQIDELRVQVQRLAERLETRTVTESVPGDPLDQALREIEPPTAATETAVPAATAAAPHAGDTASYRQELIEVSLDTLTAMGGSTADEAALRNLQGGAHDPNRQGFTLEQAELSLTGNVDPYFRGEAHILFTSHGVELEEAFLLTDALPHDLQLEAGYFLTEFGRNNPRHPHDWEWLDQPVINSRLFGGEGMRGAGFRLGWLVPLPWFAEFHFGMQNADGAGMTSFLGGRHDHGHDDGHDDTHSEEDHIAATVRRDGLTGLLTDETEPGHDVDFFDTAVGGRPMVDRPVNGLDDFAYLGRWDNAWDVSDTVSAKWGVSGLYGPNNTGADGETWIYGTDFVLKWRPVSNFRGWPFVSWESEFMRRAFRAAPYSDHSDPDHEVEYPAATLRDWGLYSQLLYGFRHRWNAGLRFEYAGGRGDSIGGRETDPFRADRFRVSPLLSWTPTEFSRIRFQYNFDHADHLAGKRFHSFWLGLEILFGAHPAHTY